MVIFFSFFCEYNSKSFLAFSLGSTKRIKQDEQGCVENKCSPEYSDSFAFDSAFEFFSSCHFFLLVFSKKAPSDLQLSLGRFLLNFKQRFSSGSF